MDTAAIVYRNAPKLAWFFFRRHRIYAYNKPS